MKADELKPFYHKTFRIEELKNYFNESAAMIRTQLSRLCKRKKLIRLKKNLYTFPDFHPDILLMGQQMGSPSYYILETALSLYGIIPEGATTYTLITSKKTQRYHNEFGTFTYRHLSPSLFLGVEKRADGVFMAVPEKALLDYLYLNSRKMKPDFECFKAERFDELDTLDFNVMKEWAKKFGMKKLEGLIILLEKYAKSDEYQGHR